MDFVSLAILVIVQQVLQGTLVMIVEILLAKMNARMEENALLQTLAIVHLLVDILELLVISFSALMIA